MMETCRTVGLLPPSLLTHHRNLETQITLDTDTVSIRQRAPGPKDRQLVAARECGEINRVEARKGRHTVTHLGRSENEPLHTPPSRAGLLTSGPLDLRVKLH